MLALPPELAIICACKAAALAAALIASMAFCQARSVRSILLDILHVVGPVDLQLGDGVLDGREHGVLLRGLALEELPRLISLGSKLGLHEGEDLIGRFRSHGSRQGAGTIIKPSGLKSEGTNQSGSSREGVGLEPKWLEPKWLRAPGQLVV